MQKLTHSDIAAVSGGNDADGIAYAIIWGTIGGGLSGGAAASYLGASRTHSFLIGLFGAHMGTVLALTLYLVDAESNKQSETACNL